MKDIREYVVQLSCDQRGNFCSQGGQGVWRGAKSAHAVFEQPHIFLKKITLFKQTFKREGIIIKIQKNWEKLGEDPLGQTS